MLRRNGITCEEVHKQSGENLPEGARTIVDQIKDGEVDMVINTPYGNSGPRVDGYEIRSAAVSKSVPCINTVQGASAAVQGIEAAIRGDIGSSPCRSCTRACGSAAVTSTETFGARLHEATGRHGSLCVGVDPHPELLEAWGLPDSVDGLEQFSEICVEAFVGQVALVKPQVAFFEAYGSAAWPCWSGPSRCCGRPGRSCWPTPSAATSAPP